MNRHRSLIQAGLLALSYNIVLLLSVVFDLSWAHTRAAGGQFSTFPTVIRITYFLMTIFMVVLLKFIWDYQRKPLSALGAKLAKATSLIFLLSTATQLISKSSAERWNAIPAFLIALAFYSLSKRSE